MSSNTNKKYYTTKLRTNETSKYSFHYSRIAPNYDTSWQYDSVASDCLPISNSKTVSEPNRIKCEDRGMANQELAESLSSLKCNIKNPNLNFSNSSIEHHFKTLQEENLKKQKEENEKKYGKYMILSKST